MFNCFIKRLEHVVVKKRGKLVSEYRSVPIVNLPLGATEDRIIGSLDIQKRYGRVISNLSQAAASAN